MGHRRRSPHTPGTQARRLGSLIPVGAAAATVAATLQGPLSVFDGGLALTLARFTSLGRLPYRDLWTLYGPGPAFMGSAVMDVFGPGLVPLRLLDLLLLSLVAAATYAIAVRFVPWWLAAALASAVPIFSHLHHFTATLVPTLWGIWLLARAGDGGTGARPRAIVGSLLLGLSFWGRYEFVLIAPAMILLAWWWLRPVVDDATRRGMLVAGMIPLLSFAAYILLVVGWDRAFQNLFDYPVRFYPRPECRGIPGLWGEVLSALATPIHGRFWSLDEITRWMGNLVPPVSGLALCVVAIRRRRSGAALDVAIPLVGILTLWLWIEHRPRAATFPAPLWPVIVVGIAMLRAETRGKARVAANGATYLLVLLILVAGVVRWVPAHLSAWGDWPDGHPRYGFARGEVSGLFQADVWAEVREVVQSRSDPGEEIFVALTDNRAHFANAPIFYWVVDRPPASRFIEFNPCLTDTIEVQREMVRDLATVRIVIATSFFPATGVSDRPQPTTLDSYLRSRFQPVYRGELPGEQTVLVLERRVRR